jgi:pimeloyl-ACP methyl ester carboxylesterase
MARKSLKYAVNAKLITYPEATHWLAHDKPNEVSTELLNHLSTVKV